MASQEQKRDSAALCALVAYGIAASSVFEGWNACEIEGNPLNDLQKTSMMTSLAQACDGAAEDFYEMMRLDSVLSSIGMRYSGGRRSNA